MRRTTWTFGLWILTVAAMTSWGTRAGAAGAPAARQDSRQVCSAAADALFSACKASAADDAFVAKAKCLNVTDDGDQNECVDELQENRSEAEGLCRHMRDGRRAACRRLGESAYDPRIDPSQFDDPRAPAHVNPYFPIAIGNRWEYRSTSGETDTVEIVDETKRIQDVTCVVARDLVEKSDGESEHTDDWYVQATDGSVWYFGEEVKNLETFEGDDPARGELVSIDGSFKWGRDRDKDGVIFQATPHKGDVYLEEFSLGNAEDVTEVLSTNYSHGSSFALDRLVPKELAQRLCSQDCVVTKNYSLLEPGAFARKYYARGIGVFLEVEVNTGEVVQLVDCNFDSRCTGLPAP